MHKLHDLKDKLIQELEDYSENGKYSKEDVESIKYMASAVDHICNIIERCDEEGEYSKGGGYPYRMMPYSYRGARDYSYARRDARGRYSRAGKDMAEELRGLMADAPDEHIRAEIERLASKVEKM